MVTQFGMSETLGPRSYGGGGHQVFLGRELGEQRDYSERYAQAIDDEVKRILVEQYQRALDILIENRAKLDELRRLIRSNPSYRLNITGYSTSDEEKARPGLAKQRAMSVRRYLVDTGVRRRNILPEAQPGAAELPTDRRVEITLVK